MALVQHNDTLEAVELGSVSPNTTNQPSSTAISIDFKNINYTVKGKKKTDTDIKILKNCTYWTRDKQASDLRE